MSSDNVNFQKIWYLRSTHFWFFSAKILTWNFFFEFYFYVEFFLVFIFLPKRYILDKKYVNKILSCISYDLRKASLNKLVSGVKKLGVPHLSCFILLFVCMCVCVCACVYVCVCTCMYVFVCVCMYACVYVCAWAWACLSVYLFVYLSGTVCRKYRNDDNVTFHKKVKKYLNIRKKSYLKRFDKKTEKQEHSFPTQRFIIFVSYNTRLRVDPKFRGS